VRLPRLPLIVAFAAALAAPGAGAGSAVRDQVDLIEADLRDMKQSIADLQATQAQFQQQMLELRTAMALDQPGRRTPADLDARISSVETDLRVLFENQNDAGQRLGMLADKMDALYRQRAQEQAAAAAAAAAAAQAQQPAVGVGTPDPAAAGGMPATPPTMEPAEPIAIEVVAPRPAAPVAAEPLVDPEEMYQAARSDYGRGSYDLALSGFREFLQKFPQSELADNALYWVGECHYAARRLDEAVATFDEVVTRFPDADKAPDAAYKKGLALLDLNRTAEGIMQLQHVRDTYPGTPAARLARTKLQGLGL
jgi:tol-pal system protein YbgF